ncbi:pyridoxamine kinase [Dysosmobacter sp.]|uniref:pyridoxamine kinase n=1 Tax=Dysosmobacter sp. TaxID=2591382 RepID=UPI001C009862|nr:pyridoxamine kinase [Oscillibacter sp.]MBT9648485.1 pyridoxamine kinase [Oscillibacter sp. MCC667]
MSTPRIAAIHDLSCFGRCSLTIALPVLSAMGCQCCPLPTALLSAHTGFPGNTFLDLAAEMGRIAEHWAAMDLQFDAIYSGFLGSADQVDTVARFFDTFKKSDTAVIVDPVMGDHGTAYRTCTPELCRGMRVLAENSDVITPNLTEAALLLDRPYEEIRQSDAYEVVRRLSLGGRRSVVLTGYSSESGQTGALCFDRDSGESKAVQTPREPQDFSGTGDLFASVLAGGVARGVPLFQAAQAAADFVRDCIARTLAEGLTEQDGVDFEPLLGQLTSSK